MVLDLYYIFIFGRPFSYFAEKEFPKSNERNFKMGIDLYIYFFFYWIIVFRTYKWQYNSLDRYFSFVYFLEVNI